MYNVPRVKANADQCLQHHQGCPETPKSADVICEQPLNSVLNVKAVVAAFNQEKALVSRGLLRD